MSVVSADLPPPILPRRRELFFGTALAAAAAGMVLLTLVGQYLAARSAADSWLGDNVIPLTQPNMILISLAMSAVTVQWAVYAVARDDRGHLYLALGMTMMFGVAAIVQSWFLATQVGLTMSQAEGPLYYGVTGTHLAMVVAGLLFLAVVALRSLGGSFSSRYPDGISAAALFWHVTVALYTVVWLAVYIMK